MKLNEIVQINPETISKQIKEISYLDTSSSYNGVVESLQELNGNLPSRAKRLVRKNDILISSVRPNLLHNCFISRNISNLVASTGYHHLRVIENNTVDPKYLFYYLTSTNKVKLYCSIAESSQSTFPSFNKSLLENMKIELPSLTTQKHIVDII